MSATHDYTQILELDDLPNDADYRRVVLCEPWSDLSVAWIGGNGFCRVRYEGVEYKNRVRMRSQGDN